ncbi:hypothetical protein SAMN05216386_2046 [Nitrosospira briensis]|uniref:DUF2169 domain-containing protein n=1 Tax=Nitrosospira briensis TaxID=35799 RepID=A0A1I5CL19_9PROT|nr:DUF2169 domain-containing protein [Nitrosospira briensis]SFN87607.1 hypothetical protein SAMN05216386_2046 [Nitrosospira briensis]
MDLINATRMSAGYTMAMEPSGRELLVVVVKGTFHLPKPGENVRLHEEQLPLIMADTFTGEPGLSAPVCEVDFALRKKRCDILLVGSAHGSGGRPEKRVLVGLRVGSMTKTFSVVGNRHWRVGVSGVSASEPEPFTVMPISYDRAFGGVDNRHEDAAKHVAFMRNPVGRGFHMHLRREWLDGAPLPNTEEAGHPIVQADGEYRPMSLGPIGRNWEPRFRYAGTYDQNWLDNVFPFLPSDFDEQYYQTAPLDQQIKGSVGGQEVTLLNLTPDGRRDFVIPSFEAPVHVFPRGGGREDLPATLDTIVFEPGEERFTITWRVARPLKKSMHEIAQVVAGRHAALPGRPVKLAMPAGHSQASLVA